MTRYLELPQAVGIIKLLGLHVQDIGLLSSALARPSSSMHGVEAYPALEMKAASLLSSLSRNHPLVDGNKRFSWVATLTFLELNGVVIEMDVDTAFDLIIRTAQGDASLDEISAVIRDHAQPAKDAAGPRS